MRWPVAALVLVLAGPAAADVWRWTDASGEEHFTDDPSSVPPERRATLRNLDDGDDEGGTFSSLGEEDAGDAVDEQQRALAVEARLRLREEHGAAVAELERLRAELSEARRESRKWRAGGRIGAADRAAEADRQVAALTARLEALEEKLASLEARLALVSP